MPDNCRTWDAVAVVSAPVAFTMSKTLCCCVFLWKTLCCCVFLTTAFQATWAKLTLGCYPAHFSLCLPSHCGCTSKAESLCTLTWHTSFPFHSLIHTSYFCHCSSISFICSSLGPFWGSFHTDYNITWQHSLAWHILDYKHQGAYKAGSD